MKESNRAGQVPNFYRICFFFSNNITSMLCCFLKFDYHFFGMILNDMKMKVEGKFIKEVTMDDDGDSITYVFPDTKEFLSILRRRINKDLTLD